MISICLGVCDIAKYHIIIDCWQYLLISFIDTDKYKFDGFELISTSTRPSNISQ